MAQHCTISHIGLYECLADRDPWPICHYSVNCLLLIESPMIPCHRPYWEAVIPLTCLTADYHNWRFIGTRTWVECKLQGCYICFCFYTPIFRQDVLWYGAVHPSVHSSVCPTVSTKTHRCKWPIFFKFCTQVCLGVPSINSLFVLSYLIKYAHNSIINDFSIFGIHRVIL